MDRRTFMIGAALALNATAAVGASAAAPAPPTPMLGGLHRVIYDARFGASLAFGEAALRMGAPAQAIDGDVSALWFDDLARHFERGGAAVAGFGAPRTLLCLLELARGPGVRVVWRGEHRHSVDGWVYHELEGPPGALARAGAALASRADWRAVMAESLLRGALHERGRAKIALRSEPSRDTAPREAVFASWVLSPRPRSTEDLG
jgi:hypothetical protein